MALRFDYASRLYLLRNGGKEASGTGSFRLGSLPALAGQPHIPHIVQGKSDLFEALRQNLPWGVLTCPRDQFSRKHPNKWPVAYCTASYGARISVRTYGHHRGQAKQHREPYEFRPCLLNPHGGTALGIDQSPRLASLASASNFVHSWQIGRSQYLVSTHASPCRISSSLSRVSPTLTKATVRP